MGGMSSVWRRLAADRRGVSAVEFALIAPIIIFLYFGLAEFCQGFMAQKRMGHVSATVADLVTRTGVTTRAELEDILEVGPLIMRPFPVQTLRQRVTSVTRDAHGVVRVDWSHGAGMTALAPKASVAIPPGLIENGESLVMTEVTYDYDSPVNYLLPALTRFSHAYYLKPRMSAQVELQP